MPSLHCKVCSCACSPTLAHYCLFHHSLAAHLLVNASSACSKMGLPNVVGRGGGDRYALAIMMRRSEQARKVGSWLCATAKL
eukprot:1022168-Pelagomonas_calceolata.AAC.1